MVQNLASTKFAFIGAGNMATAIIGGLTNATGFDKSNVYVYDRNEEKVDEFVQRGFSKAFGITHAVEKADVIVLAVKPQNFSEVLPIIKDSSFSHTDKVFVSLAAGITIFSIESSLGGSHVKVIRTMPNTPMLIGDGVVAISKNSAVSSKEYEVVTEMLSLSALTLHIDESDMNKIICATGSSPAYVFFMIQAIYEAAIAQGLDNENLLESICTVVRGSAEMVLKTKKTPQELIQMVASKGGTTEKALESFKQNNFLDIVSDAMTACTARADELGKLV